MINNKEAFLLLFINVACGAVGVAQALNQSI